MKPAFIFLALSVALCFLGFSAGTPPPNIIVMMAEDMGVGDTSAYQDWTKNADADQVKTPLMDRLARMGIRFTDAHA
jgi:arylsulfatase A-like enzyme